MTESDYYSIRDLANLSGGPTSIVADVVKFLNEEGFVNRVGTSEPLFTKSSIILTPTQTMKILECTVRE